MKYDDLEHTQDLFDIVSEVPSPIENIEMEGASKNTLEQELDFNEAVKEEKLEEVKEPKKEKKSLKEKWANLPKKKKIIFIVGMVLLFILLIVLIIILVTKKDKPENKPNNNPETPAVIIEKDNYIYRNGELAFLNNMDKEIGTYACQNKSEDLCYVANYSLEDTFFKEKNVDEQEQELVRRSAIYADNYVFIYDNESKNKETIILYNIKEQKIEGNYSLVKGFNDSNYVILKDENNKYGAYEISSEGLKEKIESSFEYLGQISKDSNLVGKKDGKYAIYDQEGSSKSKSLNAEIKSFNDKYIVAGNDSKYQIYDYQGNLISKGNYEFIELFNDYALFIENNKLTIQDYKNNRYLENEITLSNNYYNVINIYDTNLKLVETKRSFKIETDKDNIKITTYDKEMKEKNDRNINLNEVKTNAESAYINYFDGVLYFYKDKEKTNLIGSYTCNNKNSDGLNHCTVATDSFFSKNNMELDNSANLGWIPIFNNRFVFIEDSTDDNKSIVLYDLKNNKKAGQFAEVDSFSYTKSKQVSFKSTNGSYMLVKLKSNKYGMIRLGEEVTYAINPDYTSLEKFGNYYLAKDENNKYKLVSNNGSVIAGSYDNKIVTYESQYLITESDGRYQVYDFNGNKLNEIDFVYVNMLTDYYVTVDTNKHLGIFKYSDKNFKLDKDIEIYSTDYSKAFKVEQISTGFKITVGESEYITDNSGHIVTPENTDPTTDNNE